MTTWKTSDMNALVVCALLLIKVALGDACASGELTDSGQCCSLCPAGYGVSVKCGKEDTKCQPCPEGTFSSSDNLEPCLPCTKCPSSIPTVVCSATQDTQCDCDSGYFLLRSYGLCAPCSKCSRGEGVVRECGPQGDTECKTCSPGTFIEDSTGTKPCQNCTTCSENEVQIRACLPVSDTLCMDRKLHILSRPESDAPRRPSLNEVIDEEDVSQAPGSPKFTPQEESNSSYNILVYVSVLAAVVLGLLVYVAYKCWRTCKQKKALTKARAAEMGTSTEAEKLQSDSGVFLDSHSIMDNLPSKGTKRDSKLDNRLYVNLPPHRQEELESLLQEGGPGWRELGVALGYESDQLELFGRGEAPAHTLLSNWSQKEGSTLGLLSSALARIERADVVTALMTPSQGVSVV
ncbi:tumor necrosis factor receptor superfamily member 16 [Periophthalmus magnuspinnatus]|uniref:tumor necrosis factor receptor superfamily member 16 n=1 Tax=Periophthalmus magnuspinnatus TaxID=409849 RepID=UPI00145A141D|nr:tumor necrosis factor receptor superfamily member 16 [Periophthalmus magnuspinnatus]